MPGKNECEILYTCTNGFNEVSQFRLISGRGAKRGGGGCVERKGREEDTAEKKGLKQKIIYALLHGQEGQFDHNNKQLCLMIYPLRLMQIIR